MSMGAEVSRSISNSSTSITIVLPPVNRSESARRPVRAQGRRRQTFALCCGLTALGFGSCGFLCPLRRRRRVQRVEAALQRLVLFAGGDRDRLHRLELLAADHVDAAHPFADALAEGALGFAAHAGEGAGSAVHDLDEIVDQAVFGLHWKVSTDLYSAISALDPSGATRPPSGFSLPISRLSAAAKHSQAR